MAQSVERYLGKVEVTGSSPVSSFKRPEFQGAFFIQQCVSGECICAPVENFFGKKVYIPVLLC